MADVALGAVAFITTDGVAIAKPVACMPVVFYPRGLVVAEVGCSLFLVEGVLRVLQYKEQLHYGLGSNLTDLESPLRRR